jgi:hypothetical protein
MLSVLTRYFALSLYGILIPFAQLVLVLPFVYLLVALPITAAHRGGVAAFLLGNALDVKILAYSLATHFTFMFCNGLIGLFFLPRASRKLAALGAMTSSDEQY